MKINLLVDSPRALLKVAVVALGTLGLTIAIACGQSESADPVSVHLTQPPGIETAASATAEAAAMSSAAEAKSTAPEQEPSSANGQVADIELSPGQIVAAHDLVMSDIYDRTVRSIVGLRVIASVNMGDGIPGRLPNDFLSRASGSGFVWDDQGHILTNRHVVNGADRIVVVLSDGSQTDAEIVGADPDSDLAIIRIIDDEVRPPPVALGDSDAITPGQLAVAIGDPFSRGFSMTSGIISAVGRTINPTDSNFSVPRVIQHDAATNPGNSGGPLLNRYGEVIGINTQIISETGAFSGIGLAVPINLARLVAPALIEDGRYEYPYIGIRGTTLGPDIASAMGLPDDTRGALVLAVSADSAAQRAGLQPANQTTVVDGLELPIGGDIIVAINGEPIKGMDDVIAYVIEHTRPGDTVEFTVIRDGNEVMVSITMGGRPE